MTRIDKVVHSRVYILEVDEVKKAIMAYMDEMGRYPTEKYTYKMQNSGICIIEMIDKVDEESKDV